jgi:hypothetical protein
MTELDKKIEEILERDLYLKKDFEQSKSDIKQLMKEYHAEQLRIGGVSNRRELLFAWEKYKKEFPYSDIPVSELIEKYISCK